LCLLAVALSLVSPWFLLWPASYALVLAVFSVKLAVQHRTAAGLLAGRAALTMHAAWACGFFSGLISHRERTWQREMTVPLPVGEGS
jgi:succinoglycan biosynthesis protein ExoA